MKRSANTYSKDWLADMTDKRLEAFRSETARHLRTVPAELKHHEALMLGLPQINRERRLRR